MVNDIFGIPIGRLVPLIGILLIAILILWLGEDSEIRKSAVEASRWVFAGVVAGMTLAAAGTDNMILLIIVIPYALAIGIAGDYVVRRVYRFPYAEVLDLDEGDQDG